jgi:N-acetylglucosaminyl-diphospho-decaprenol L-rhamnosyltransferase
VTGDPAAVVAVVVTYRADPDDLRECLDALERAGGLAHVVVIDNGGHVDLVADAGRTIVRPARNAGYGAAANEGAAVARRCGAGAVVLLNDDVVVTDGWLDPLLAELADPAVGAVQPMLVLGDGAHVNSLGVAIGPDGAGVDIAFGEPIDRIDGSARTIDVFSAGVVLFRPAFLDATGGFDERFFLYYEDVDLARRGAELNWSYRCAPEAVVVHRKGASTSELGDRLVYLQERNRLWSAFLHESPGTIARALWLSLRRLRHPPQGVHLRALVVGIGGGIRRLIERARR